MIQLAYQPAYDPFHTVLRLIRLTDKFANLRPTKAQISIADFYLLFPHRLDDIRLTRPMRKRVSAIVASVNGEYGAVPAASAVYRKMKPIQEAAIQTLLSNGSLQGSAYEIGRMTLDGEAVSARLLQRARELNDEESPLVDFIEDLIQSLPVDGEDGLKHRTGLEEHRYDAV